MFMTSHADTSLSFVYLKEQQGNYCTTWSCCVLKQLEKMQLSSPPPAAGGPDGLQLQLTQLLEEKEALEENSRQQEAEVNKYRLQLGSMREERDRLKRRVGMGKCRQTDKKNKKVISLEACISVS